MSVGTDSSKKKYSSISHDVNLSRAKIEAEAVPELSERYNVEVVPSFVFLAAGGSVVDKLEGANAPEAARLTTELIARATTAVSIEYPSTNGKVTR